MASKKVWKTKHKLVVWNKPPKRLTPSFKEIKLQDFKLITRVRKKIVIKLLLKVIDKSLRNVIALDKRTNKIHRISI